MMEDFKPLIKNTKFVHLWTSQILSQLTINIMNFLLLIRLFEHTGSTIATSLLWAAYALPAIRTTHSYCQALLFQQSILSGIAKRAQNKPLEQNTQLSLVRTVTLRYPSTYHPLCRRKATPHKK